jgi:hypothetical protein
VRTTAKPALRWWSPPRLRTSSDLVIGVDADALGGVAYVDFYVEGNVQRVTQTRFDDTDANGKPRSRVGYWMTLSNSAFLTKNATGAANIYAKATANDATMQARVIGPLVIYPRSSQFDWDKTVKPSGGGDFTSFRAALDALIAAAPECGRITFMETGSYEGGSPTGSYNGAKGFHRIAAAPGVTATIVHGARFDPTNASGIWDWYPGVSGVEFYGSGVVLDTHNWRQIITNSTALGYWFNGCKVTNSAGTQNSLYWNKGAQPTFLASSFSSSDVPLYWTDATVEYVTAPFGYATPLVTGCKINGVLSTTFDNAQFVADNYVANCSTSYFRNQINALSISYSGAAATATISKDFAATGRGSLYLYANGALVKRYDFTDLPPATPGAGGLWFNISDIVNDINALGGGWSASLLDDTRNATAIMGEQSFTNLNVKGAVQTLPSFFSFHDEWIHLRGSVENIILRNNICRASVFSTSFFNQEAGQNGLDIMVKGNVWENGGKGSGGTSGLAGRHLVFCNNILDGNATAPNTPTSGPGGLTTIASDAYSLCAQNIIPGGIFYVGPGWPAYPAMKDNIVLPGWVGMPAGPNDSGNVVCPDPATYAACFTSKAAGDYRPAGLLLNNMKPRLDPWDGRVNGRAATDAIGAWASGYTAPTYPL